ncbi:hypothetical protein ISU10_18540 [Nocardioides agariphilus]|uniref:DUF7508 domain-containing protein n=1 Tax=Nocardioides agariphilus TaxID=433664 RepID=A0A930VN93_9ACTN|nr:hypothetical protein [Nocardioides agariphilus]MBF4769772.1 hypothetical protein [Nocardioides agariphilus]
MSIRMDKEWLPFTPEQVADAPGHMGVYQIADADRQLLDIGRAGGGTRFGLRGELTQALERWGDRGRYFRFEVNLGYWSRHQELLMLALHDHGHLPEGCSEEQAAQLGRISPHPGNDGAARPSSRTV